MPASTGPDASVVYGQQLPWLSTEGPALSSLLIALALLWLCLAVGRRLLTTMSAWRGASLAERGVLAAGAGAGLLQFVPFALGALGVLSVTSVRVALGVAVLVFVRDLRAVALAGAEAVARRSGPGRWNVTWLIALSPALLAALLVALVPTFDDDGLAYHLTAPKRWMHHGSLTFLPTYPATNVPMGGDMLFALAMGVGGDIAAKCVHFVLGLVGGCGTYLAATRLRGPLAGVLAATLFLVAPGGLANVLGFAYVEGTTALNVAGSVLAWLIWLRDGHRAFLWAAALLAGTAVSFKLSVAVFPVGMVLLTAIASYDKASRDPTGGAPLRTAVKSGALLVPLIALPVLPWMFRSLFLTGNPFYPLFGGLIPSRDIPAHLASSVAEYNRLMTWGNAVGREWTMEQRSWILLGVGGAWLLLCGATALRYKSRMARGAALVVAVVGLAQFSAAGLYLRYWLPLGAALLVPAAAVLAPCLSHRRVAYGWVALTLLFSLLQVRRSALGDPSTAASYVATVLGLQDSQTFLRRHLPLFPLYERVNRELPDEAGVLLSAYCGGFYIDRRTYCGEMVHTSLRYWSWDEFVADLRNLHITHVIAPQVLATQEPLKLSPVSSVSAVTREDQYRMVRRLLNEHARRLAAASDQGLYEIVLPVVAEQ